MAPLFTLPATPPPAVDLPAVAAHSGASGRHTVRAEETVYGIAQQYGTTSSAIARANSLSDARLVHPGEVLVIPANDSGATKRPARTVGGHTVSAGETLSGIAARYGTTTSAIAKSNGIAPSSIIRPGQKLRVPGATDRVERSFDTAQRSTSAASRGGASRSQVRDLITSTANRYGVDPSLALAIGWQESGWQQGVSSHVGAVGVMQVMPGSGKWAGGLIDRSLDLHDLEDNVTAGVVILAQLGRMAENRDEVIAAYYQGLGSVRERGWYSDTRQYVANVNYFRSRL